LSGPGVGAHQTDDGSGQVELTYLQHLWQKKAFSLPNSPMTHFLEDLAVPENEDLWRSEDLSWFIVSLVSLGGKGYLGPGGARQIYLSFNKSLQNLEQKSFISPHFPTPSTHCECLPQN